MDDRLPQPVRERIEPEPNSGCWLWIGSVVDVCAQCETDWMKAAWKQAPGPGYSNGEEA